MLRIWKLCAKNGRLGRVKALVASALKIKPVMGATPEGTICQLDQARGMNKAIVKWWITLERRDQHPGKDSCHHSLQLSGKSEDAGGGYP